MVDFDCPLLVQHSLGAGSSTVRAKEQDERCVRVGMKHTLEASRLPLSAAAATSRLAHEREPTPTRAARNSLSAPCRDLERPPAPLRYQRSAEGHVASDYV